MKKISILFIGLISMKMAFASNFDGLYLGAGITGGQILATQSQVSTAPADINTYSDNFSKGSAMGNFFAGYGMAFKNTYYLGAELAYTTDTGTANTSNIDHPLGGDVDNIGQSLQLKSQFSLGVLGGVLLSQNALVYARIDALNAKPNYSASETLTATNGSTTTVWKISDSPNTAGIGMGLGLQYKLGKGFSIRGQGEYDIYKTITATGASGNTAIRESTTPRMFNFTLAGVYTF